MRVIGCMSTFVARTITVLHMSTPSKLRRIGQIRTMPDRHRRENIMDASDHSRVEAALDFNPGVVTGVAIFNGEHRILHPIQLSLAAMQTQ